MTAVKTIARVLAVLALVAPAGLAGPIATQLPANALPTGEFRWKAWNPGQSGAISNTLTPPPASAGSSRGPGPAPAPVAPPRPAPAPAPAPAPRQVPPPSPPAPVGLLSPSAPTPAPRAEVPPAPTPRPLHRADALIQMGEGPYIQADLLTGQPDAWYRSPVAREAFGGTPDAAQRQAFSDLVLDRVERVFVRSGMNPRLTTDPNVPADHVMSVVSNASYGGPDSGVIGITDVGNNGFSLIDNMGSAKTVDTLAYAVANNVAHELMHAFGVADHPDQTGTRIDTGLATFELLTSADATFSQAAVRGMLSDDGTIRRTGLGAQVAESGHPRFCACQSHRVSRTLAAQIQAVPEPATMALWALAALGTGLARRARNKVAA